MFLYQVMQVSCTSRAPTLADTSIGVVSCTQINSQVHSAGRCEVFKVCCLLRDPWRCFPLYAKSLCWRFFVFRLYVMSPTHCVCVCVRTCVRVYVCVCVCVCFLWLWLLAEVMYIHRQSAYLIGRNRKVI